MKKIVFLGTGGGRYMLSTQKRATGGFLLFLDGKIIHIDPGPGAIVRINQKKIDLRKVNGVFVSHCHIDHCNDILPILEGITEGGYKGKKGEVIVPESLINPEIDDSGHRIPEEFKRRLEKLIVGKVNKEYDFLGFNIKLTPAEHDVKENFGFILQAKDIIIGYTSDTEFFPELIDIFKDCDVLIINCMRYSTSLGKHMNFEGCKELIKNTNCKLYVTTHFGFEMERHKPNLVFNKLSRELNKKIIAAQDFMEIDLKRYI